MPARLRSNSAGGLPVLKSQLVGAFSLGLVALPALEAPARLQVRFFVGAFQPAGLPLRPPLRRILAGPRTVLNLGGRGLGSQQKPQAKE